MPYLAKIPEETEVLFSVFFGALSVAFYTQSKSMKLDEKMKMYSVSGTIEAIHPGAINGAAENVFFLKTSRVRWNTRTTSTTRSSSN